MTWALSLRGGYLTAPMWEPTGSLNDWEVVLNVKRVSGVNNAVIFSISDYTEIKLTIGGETYSTLLHTDKLFILDGILVLDIGLTTSLDIGVYTPRITGDNYIITCDRYKRMQPIQIINC